MPLLTTGERQAVLGVVLNAPKEKQAAIKKLNEFQKLMSNKPYIVSINALIPAAEKVAKKAAKKGKCFDRVFHREMNARARAAGLRA